MTNTEQAVRAAFDHLDSEHPYYGRPWIGRYDSELYRAILAEYRRLFPGRRNAPTYRNIENALGRMVSAGLLEKKVIEDGTRKGETLYRKRVEVTT